MINNKAPVRNAILTFKDSNGKVANLEIKCGGDKVKNSNNKYTAKARVKFNIEKKISIFSYLCHILIYNVKRDTIRYILQNFDTIELQAGYNNNLGTVFSGFINEVFYRKENDYIFEIYAISNVFSRLKINISYTKNTSNLDILKKLNEALSNLNSVKINYSLADKKFLFSNFGNGTVANYVATLNELMSGFYARSYINEYKYEHYYDDVKNIIFITTGGNYNKNDILDINSNNEINEYTARFFEAQELLDENYFNNIVYKENSTQTILQNNNILLSALTNLNEKKYNFTNNIIVVIKIDHRINIGTVVTYILNDKKYIFQVVEITTKGDTHLITNNWNCTVSLKKMDN